jgi:hypothetical protein
VLTFRRLRYLYHINTYSQDIGQLFCSSRLHGERRQASLSSSRFGLGLRRTMLVTDDLPELGSDLVTALHTTKHPASTCQVRRGKKGRKPTEEQEGETESK